MLPENQSASILRDFTVQTEERLLLPARVCADHLQLLGASRVPSLRRDGTTLDLAGAMTLHPLHARSQVAATVGSIDCTLLWRGTSAPTSDIPDSEATLQAISGLMEVHGRDHGRPRRLGLEVASFAAGLIATQGLLAAMIGNYRGHSIRNVRTSVLQAALLFVNHHLALATCENQLSLPASTARTGPPFPTADGHCVELEMLSFEAWMAFWGQLGVAPETVKRAWSPFVYRYLTARCSLPLALHEATQKKSLAELQQLASASGAALCRVRTYSEVLAEQGQGDNDRTGKAESQFSPSAPWLFTPGNFPYEGKEPHKKVSGGPLSGLRVVECTSRLQGPLAGLLLRMLGADVTKVEPPGGDFTRFSPPLAGSLSAAYLAYNRDKEILEIDYKLPSGRAELLDHIATADVFLHNWRAGRSDQLGITLDTLTQSNPGLIYAHASGWGRILREPSPFTGDCLVQAYAACGDGLSPVGEAPLPSRLTLIDTIGGLLACEGILAGLCWREQTQRGCQVDTSLLAGAMGLQADILQRIAAGQEVSGRDSFGRPCWSLLDSPMQTANGFLFIDVEDERSRQRLFEVCNIPSGIGKAHSATYLSEQLLQRPAAEWEQLMRQAGVPAVTVQSELANLPRDLQATELLDSITDSCRAPSTPWQFDSEPR